MLRGLDIRDMLIIDRLALEFQPGLNVLTGETGAGKSILLDALGFVLGWRGRAELVRAGAEQGEVTAVFELKPGHSVHKVLAEAGIEAEDGELIAVTKIRRRTTVADYARLQRRFAHVFKPENAHQLEALQAIADRNIKRFDLLAADAEA